MNNSTQPYQALESDVRPPLRFVVADGHGNRGTLCCPVCGEAYVHLGPVAVEQGHSQAVIVRDGIEVRGSTRHKRARGSQVRLAFYGECGHRFDYWFSFHKGNVTAKLTAEVMADDEPAFTLWRD